jgi:hypothetical protein
MLLMCKLPLLSLHSMLHLGIVMTWSGSVVVRGRVLLLPRRLRAVGHLVGAMRLMADLVGTTTVMRRRHGGKRARELQDEDVYEDFEK